jgi:hypothetical protein
MHPQLICYPLPSALWDGKENPPLSRNDASTSKWIFWSRENSREIAPFQYRHLIDSEKCAQTEHRYGPITGKFVLYRGEDQILNGIQYQNIEEYLRNL